MLACFLFFCIDSLQFALYFENFSKISKIAKSVGSVHNFLEIPLPSSHIPISLDHQKEYLLWEDSIATIVIVT